jgi:hypothetical protein
MRNMFSCNAYLSRAMNTVYVGDSAREAREFERQPNRVYSPFGQDNSLDNQVYSRSYKELPLTSDQVKASCTVYRNPKGRFDVLYIYASRPTSSFGNYTPLPEGYPPNIATARCRS